MTKRPSLRPTEPMWPSESRAIRNAALEEAARVAETIVTKHEAKNLSYSYWPEQIAAAIRALKE